MPNGLQPCPAKDFRIEQVSKRGWRIRVAILAKRLYSRGFPAQSRDVNRSTKLTLGGASFQKVKQPLQGLLGFIVNPFVVRRTMDLTIIVHCTIRRLIKQPGSARQVNHSHPGRTPP